MKGLFISTALLLSGNALASFSANVVGGNDAGSRFEWMAGLHRYFPDTSEYVVNPFCGGSLIAPGWVVTAAHCLDGGTLPGEMLLRIDQPALRNSSGYIEPLFRASALVLHENYRDVTSGFDIALVRLARKVERRTINIADDTLMDRLDRTAFNRDAVRALGWGIFDNENFDPESPGLGDYPDTLQSLVLDYFPPFRLSASRPDNVVAAYEPSPGDNQPFGADTCYGDSGGPLILNDRNINFEESELGPMLVGITSYGSSNCDSRTSPGIYTRVSAYTRWIEQQTAALGDALADLAISLSHPTRDLQTGSTSDDVVVTITNQSDETQVASFNLYVDMSRAGVSVMSGTDTGLDCDGSIITPTCSSTASLDAGDSLSYHFSITDQTSRVRTANIQAMISAQSQDDYRPYNNKTSLTLNYANGADLSLSLDSGPTSSGEFTINVRNLSDLFTATDTLVNLDITPAAALVPPPGCSRVDEIRIQCALGDLAPEQVFSRTVRLTRKPDSTTTRHDIDASVSHTGEDPASNNNSDSYPFFSPALEVPRLSSGGSNGGAAALLLCLLLLPGMRRLAPRR